MLALSQTKTKRLVAIHGWSGTVLGLLLYAVVLSGAVAVFAHEIGVWSQGGTGARGELQGPIDNHIRKAARNIDPKYMEEVSIFEDSTGDIGVFFHSHEINPDTGSLSDVGVDLRISRETGEITERFEGFISDKSDPMGALESFLVDVHVQLYVPAPWGLILTGILGLAMMTAAISGFIMHRHIFRDLFLPARDNQRLSSSRDRHILAGAWGLPFAVVLAFTGAFFSFAISIGLPVVSMVAFGGDQEKMIETLIGVPGAKSNEPASLASLDYMLLDSENRAGSPASNVIITNYGTESATVLVGHRPTNGALSGIQLMFDGPTRTFLGEKPFIGTESSAGNSLLMLMGPLHFGNFAGLASKLAWFALGGAMSYVIVTGMRLWTRRRSDQPMWRKFDRAVTAVGWGLPIALCGSAVAFFLSVPAGDPEWWTPAAFVIASAVAIALSLGREDPDEKLRKLLAILFLALPVLRHITGGTSWGEAIVTGQSTVLCIDFLLLIGGGLLLRINTPAASPAPPQLEPAE